MGGGVVADRLMLCDFGRSSVGSFPSFLYRQDDFTMYLVSTNSVSLQIRVFLITRIGSLV